MDVEQEEMQFLGLFGIFNQSFRLIYSWRKIFTQITLALILPVSFIFLVQIQVSHIILSKLIYNEIELEAYTKIGSAKYNKLSDLIRSEEIELLLFKVVYFTILLIFSLLSTSAVVYTVASAYSSREISFKRVMSVVPKVWKRLMATFLCMFIAMFLYNFCFGLLIVLWATLITRFSVIGNVLIILLILLYMFGLVYMTVVWQLASVVSVLENSCGLQAMVKSKNLLKGKLIVSSFIFLGLILLTGGLQFAFERLVMHRERHGTVQRVGFGLLILILLLALVLIWLVLQTVIYFVCKSYHHENVDKSSLSDHLELYLGEYVPLKARDLQLQQFHV